MNNRPIKSHIARIFLAFATAVVAVSGSRLALAQGWTAATPYPTTIARYGFAQNGEDMYVIAGAPSGDTVSTTVRRYNATTNVWTSLANIPVGSEGPAAAFHGGKIYVADGFLGVDAFRIYDIATNTWSAGPPRPGGADSNGAAAGAFNGKVYIAGGGSGGGTSVLSIYNIASNSWSAGPASPSLYHHSGYAQIGQFLYLIGSVTGTLTNSSVSMRLDMATNTWSTGPVWTPQRADFALAAAGSKLFALGGDLSGGNFFNPSAQVNELETSTWPAGAWSPSPDNLPTARQGNRAGFFSTGRAGGEIWSTGGTAAGPTYLNAHLFRSVPPCPDYTITKSTRPLVAASTDIGNHCDDCVTAITFPFPVSFYGTTYTSANASSNGNLQFAGATTSSGNTNLPAAGFNATIFAFWDNLLTTGAGNGIFTSVTGAAPKRIFTIEWRVSNLIGTGTSKFEIQFFEGSPDFEVIYGATTGPFRGTIGVQRDATSLFTQFAGPTAVPPAANTRLLFTTGCCAPIAFNGAIGFNSNTYPGSSGTQTGRLVRDSLRSVCGTAKLYPGAADSIPRTADVYSFNNAGPAACVTFSVYTTCTAPATQVFPVAYLGSYNPASIAANYLGDPGLSPDPFESFSVDVPANSTVVLVVHEVQAQGACGSYDVVVTGLCPLELTSAVSRKTHGVAGEFNIPLPLIGQPGVECRTGQPASGNHKHVFTFNSVVTSGDATVTTGVGSAGAPTFSGTTMTVPLSGVTDIQKSTVTLSGVTNSNGRVLPNTAVSMNVLLGDTTGNKTVNASDIGQTKSKSGQAASAANFRNDTTVSGAINSSDIGQVKANSGHSVP